MTLLVCGLAFETDECLDHIVHLIIVNAVGPVPDSCCAESDVLLVLLGGHALFPWTA